ncbi:MAG TPA: hypothetical protein PKM73_19190 [Verrucomicrobiota bacterium]|nr:hypothetical protein [Verrucomicrobiota bacterium]HNU52424.1 hypothetical protein [Verrucomicrobiota bacterium]
MATRYAKPLRLGNNNFHQFHFAKLSIIIMKAFSMRLAKLFTTTPVQPQVATVARLYRLPRSMTPFADGRKASDSQPSTTEKIDGARVSVGTTPLQSPLAVNPAPP